MTHADSGAIPTTLPPPEHGERESSSPPDTLDIQQVAGRAWRLFAAAPLTYVLAGLLLTVASGMTAGILFGPLVVGLARMVERQMRGEQIAAGQVFDGLGRFGQSLVTVLLFAAGTFLAGVAFVVPGVVLAVLWSFALHFVALEDATATDAMRGSWKLVRNNIGSVLLVLICLVGVNFLGSLVVVGVIVAAPFSFIIMTLSFCELAHQ